MIYTYGESFAVDIEHADVAYRLFDAWKAMGLEVTLDVSTKGVAVSYKRTIVTIDRNGDT